MQMYEIKTKELKERFENYSLLDLENIDDIQLVEYFKNGWTIFLEKSPFGIFLFLNRIRSKISGRYKLDYDKLYEDKFVHNQIINTILQCSISDYYSNKIKLREYIEAYFEEFKEYYNKSDSISVFNEDDRRLFVETYYTKLDKDYLRLILKRFPEIITIENKKLFYELRTERYEAPFVKLPNNFEKCYLKYEPYDLFEGEMAELVKRKIEEKINNKTFTKSHFDSLQQFNKEKAIYILLKYNGIVLRCLNLFEDKINYEEIDLFEIFSDIVFTKKNVYSILDKLQLNEEEFQEIIKILKFLNKLTSEDKKNLTDQFIDIKRVENQLWMYKGYEKLKRLYYKSYEKKCKSDKQKTDKMFLKNMLSDNNFLKLLDSNRLTATDVEDILITSKIFGDDFRKHLEEIIKYHREQSLANYNKIVRASFVNGDELDKILNELGLNKDNIYDYILNNKVLHKKEKEGLISIVKVHYKDYISVLDVMYLLDEMVERKMTIDEILKEKEINKKDFYDLYKKSLDDNPILYEYISGKLQENKKRGFKKFIKLAYYIINNISSYLEYQERFNYDINDVLNSLEQTTVYDLILEKIKSWPDYDLAEYAKTKK